eukprot:6188128-Pleurochrysis_carterae.AAC.5
MAWAAQPSAAREPRPECALRLHAQAETCRALTAVADPYVSCGARFACASSWLGLLHCASV